jgi:hypothetical protein
MRPLLAALALAAFALSGCGSACQDLGNRICDCQTAGTARDNCRSAVKSQLSSSAVSGDDQTYCQSKLATCPDPATDAGACDALKTAAGKAACGIGY